MTISYGTLEVLNMDKSLNEKYTLLSPFPINLDDWTKGMFVFHVLTKEGDATHIILHGVSFSILFENPKDN